MAEQINLEGTNLISNIPGVYFDATSQLVENVGGEVNAGMLQRCSEKHKLSLVPNVHVGNAYSN